MASFESRGTSDITIGSSPEGRKVYCFTAVAMTACSILVLFWSWLVGLPHAWFNSLALADFIRKVDCQLSKAKIEGREEHEERCRLGTEVFGGMWVLFLSGFICFVMLLIGLGFLSRYIVHGRAVFKQCRAQDRLLYSVRTFYAAAVCSLIHMLTYVLLLLINSAFQPGKVSLVCTIIAVSSTLVLTFVTHRHFAKQVEALANDDSDSEDDTQNIEAAPQSAYSKSRGFADEPNSPSSPPISQQNYPSSSQPLYSGANFEYGHHGAQQYGYQSGPMPNRSVPWSGTQDLPQSGMGGRSQGRHLPTM